MKLLELADTALAKLANYHQHEVVGLEHIPANGAALIVVNHSLATYDSGLLAAAVREQLGRKVWLLGDRYMFKIPVVRDLVSNYGFIEGSQSNAARLLRDGELVLVAPGGMREALKPSSKKYQLDIADRKGFAKLSIHTQSPVILSACPAADDIYHVVANPLTDWVYSRYKLAAPIMFGAYGTIIPKPVKLLHHLNPPITPPDAGSDEEDTVVDAFHRVLLERLQTMLHDACQNPAG